MMHFKKTLKKERQVKTMAKKKTNQQEKKVQVKKKVQKRKKNTRRHVKGEIISWEELENTTGLTGDETVFDAYCGTGTITLFLSQKAKKVYGVEIIPQAIENANINAKENNANNVEFFVGESEVVIPDLINKGIKADVVVVDPPRKGCDVKLLNAIGDLNFGDYEDNNIDLFGDAYEFLMTMYASSAGKS